MIINKLTTQINKLYKKINLYRYYSDVQFLFNNNSYLCRFISSIVLKIQNYYYLKWFYLSKTFKWNDLYGFFFDLLNAKLHFIDFNI